MKNCVKKEVEKIIEEYKLNCSVKEFGDKADFKLITSDLKLSLDFIKEFKNKVYWPWISLYYKMSEKFIREHKDYVNWYYISKKQNLVHQVSDKFIEEFRDEIKRDFVEYRKKEMKFFNRSFCQEDVISDLILSKDFAKEFGDKLC